MAFKRILFFSKVSQKQKDILALDHFAEGCFGRIINDTPGRINEFLKKAQAEGVRGKFLVIDEMEFAGSGLIANDVIVGGEK